MVDHVRVLLYGSGVNFTPEVQELRDFAKVAGCSQVEQVSLYFTYVSVRVCLCAHALAAFLELHALLDPHRMSALDVHVAVQTCERWLRSVRPRRPLRLTQEQRRLVQATQVVLVL